MTTSCKPIYNLQRFEDVYKTFINPKKDAFWLCYIAL